MYKPIFVDKNVRPDDYSHLANDELLVTSIFHTIQGEGPFAGKRALFLRLAGCNLGGKGVEGPGCDFCDTNFKFAEGTALKFRELFKRISNAPCDKNGKQLVIITGGEPMLQENLIYFLQEGRTLFRNVIFQIESNGTRLLSIPKTQVHLVVSPKIPVSNTAANALFKYSKLSDRVLERADCLKFVVDINTNSPYHSIPDYAFDFMEKGKKVYISPITIHKKERCLVTNAWDDEIVDQVLSAQNYQYAAKLAMEHGFIVSIQMHIFLGCP